MLGVQDDFDRDYISSQVEKCCTLYGLRNHAEEENSFASAPSEHAAKKAVDTSKIPYNAPIIPRIIDNSHVSIQAIPVAGMHPSIMNSTYTDPTSAALAIMSSTTPKQLHKKGKIDISIELQMKTHYLHVTF